MNPRAFLGSVVLFAFATVAPIRGETAYFLMSGPQLAPSYLDQNQQAYVVAVSDPALIAQAREFLASGPPPLPEVSPTSVLIPEITVAAGTSSENLNYAHPDKPAWPWHATSLVRWEYYDPLGVHPAVILPDKHSAPYDIPDLLADGIENVALVYYPLVMEIDPAKRVALANLSTRGWVDAGERVLIGGFVIQGQVPRWVLIRARGPSLAEFGIQEPLSDPKITLFQGSTPIASNDSWRDGILGTLFPPPDVQTFAPPPAELAWMPPDDDREPALWLALKPGAYTVHVSSADGAPGIAVVEVFDPDALDGR